MCDISRFHKYVIPVTESGCWLWNGSINTWGYGQFWHKCKNIPAHRFAFSHYCGAVPKGMVVMHKCDVRSCVNPNHLRLGTYADNSTDMVNKGRQAFGDRSSTRLNPMVCTKRGDRNGNNKYTPEQIEFVRNSDMPARMAGFLAGVSLATVQAVRSGKQWAKPLDLSDLQ